MKWGVRKEQKREANRKLDSFLARVGTRHDLATAEITEAEYKKLPSKPVKLGSDFLRIDGKNKGTLRNDIVYVSKNEHDHNRYKAVLAPGGKASAKRFELKVKTATEAISPSHKERIDTFIRTIGQDIPDPHGGPAVSGRVWVEGEHPDPGRALNNRELGLKYYNTFAQQQVHATPLHTAYFNNLKKKGYNALVDDADRGHISDLPIVLFPKESGASVVEIKRVSKQELIDARSNLKLFDD
jgi:hypothetical protein